MDFLKPIRIDKLALSLSGIVDNRDGHLLSPGSWLKENTNKAKGFD
jgi:hypothetical protein